MYISTLRNIKWGVEGLLVRWTGPPSPGGPWHQKVGKKNKLAMHIAMYVYYKYSCTFWFSFTMQIQR